MTLLGFDFGLKHIGIAVGQTLTNTAQALTSIAAKKGIPTWDEIDKLIKNWRPTALVIGYPLNMDGTEQAISIAARSFAEALHERYQLPVHLVDERLSTVEARRMIFEEKGYKGLKKSTIDSTSAQLILESWLQNN